MYSCISVGLLMSTCELLFLCWACWAWCLVGVRLQPCSIGWVFEDAKSQKVFANSKHVSLQAQVAFLLCQRGIPCHVPWHLMPNTVMSCHVMSVSFMLVTKMCACHESCVSSRPNGFHVEVKGVQPWHAIQFHAMLFGVAACPAYAGHSNDCSCFECIKLTTEVQSHG